jgi:Terpene synthase family 2, C-terminal metal binding
VTAFRSRYLATLSPGERRRILDVAHAVTESSEQWLQRYPIVRRRPVTAACSLVSTVGMPGLAVPELTLMTCWWLWIFGIDDRFDDLGTPEAELAEWSRHFTRIVRQEPADSADDLLLAAFGALRRDLAPYPLYPMLAETWQKGTADVVDGMLAERRWAGAATTGEPPSYDEYLANGIKTIAVRPYTVTACIVAGEPAAAAGFARLDPAIQAAARCFRLANDLRSEAREREEGTLNAVALLQRAFRADGMSEAAAATAARARLRAACVGDLAKLKRLRAAAPSSTRSLTRFLCAHAAFVCDMYEFNDYDSLSELLGDGALA